MRGQIPEPSMTIDASAAAAPPQKSHSTAARRSAGLQSPAISPTRTAPKAPLSRPKRIEALVSARITSSRSRAEDHRERRAPTRGAAARAPRAPVTAARASGWAARPSLTSLRLVLLSMIGQAELVAAVLAPARDEALAAHLILGEGVNVFVALELGVDGLARDQLVAIGMGRALGRPS